MNWTIEQLLAFVTAGEQGSFSAAGRTLGRAQSVISTHISTLEDTLGVELFDRSSRFPILTEAGHDLLPEAKAVLRQSYRFESRALARFNGEAIRLSISVCYGLSFEKISETVATLIQRYPYITGSLRMDSEDKVWNDVKERRSHIGLVLGETPPTGDIYGCICLGYVQYCAVAAKDFPLAQLPVITQQDLAQHRQILSEDESRYLFSSQYWLVNNVSWAIQLVSLGVGWTVVPLDLAHRAVKATQNLVILNLEKHSMPIINVHLIWNMELLRRDILDFFHEDLQKRYTRILHPSENN